MCPVNNVCDWSLHSVLWVAGFICKVKKMTWILSAVERMFVLLKIHLLKPIPSVMFLGGGPLGGT